MAGIWVIPIAGCKFPVPPAAHARAAVAAAARVRGMLRTGLTRQSAA